MAPDYHLMQRVHEKIDNDSWQIDKHHNSAAGLLNIDPSQTTYRVPTHSGRGVQILFAESLFD